MNLDKTLTTNNMLGLVVVRYNNLPIRLLYSHSSTFLSSSFLPSFSFVCIGVLTGLQSFMLNFFKTFVAYLSCDMKMPFQTKISHFKDFFSCHL
ncbi:hypothetical protein Syun_005694 [Stephania yunnanensis]|uniref:Uncharacterized protein n=1 Tax=Stephania yunnanensis TaxID=152371 RepID=A0AAP0L6P4_9MAGN